MPRPRKDRRPALLSAITEVFTSHGYRGATTAELARACGLQENELYRVWKSKKAMFLDAIEFVYEATMRDWGPLLEDAAGNAERSAAERLLEHQAKQHGHSGLYRIVFAGLNEAHDSEIRGALRRLYQRFHALLESLTTSHRESRGLDRARIDAALSAWAVIGIGAAIDVQRELRIGSQADRAELLRHAGMLAFDGGPER